MPRKFSGAHARNHRERAGLRPEAVALEIGRSSYTVQEYERGRVIPSLSTVIHLADTYHCTVDDLLEEVADAV
jgi:transcriptional regulator with XRE-family HTH domain